VSENAWALLAVTSFHPSGRVRESAVRALDNTQTGNELPFLIVRLNDWVDVVAERARDAVSRRMDQTWAREWAHNLPLVQRLAAATRRNQREFVDDVYAVLRKLPSGDALDAMLSLDDQSARRTAFRLAREGATGAERVALVERALRERVPAIRFDALRDACESFDNDTLAPIVDAARGDAFMPIRRRALEASIERYPELAVSRARDALLDASPAMREVGRRTVAQREPTTSVAQFYREQLVGGSVSQLVPVIAGLGETGQVSDAELVSPFVADTRPRVRREAIRSLGRLAALANASTITSALMDSSAKVVRAACEVVKANPSLVDYETVRTLVEDAPFTHSRIQALRLSSSLGKWANLQLLLEAARTSDPAVGAEVRKQVGVWLATANARSTVPTTRQTASISELLNNVSSPWIDDSRREWLRGFLSAWT
jgi:hypothetical protein